MERKAFESYGASLKDVRNFLSTKGWEISRDKEMHSASRFVLTNGKELYRIKFVKIVDEMYKELKIIEPQEFGKKYEAKVILRQRKNKVSIKPISEKKLLREERKRIREEKRAIKEAKKIEREEKRAIREARKKGKEERIKIYKHHSLTRAEKKKNNELIAQLENEKMFLVVEWISLEKTDPRKAKLRAKVVEYRNRINELTNKTINDKFLVSQEKLETLRALTKKREARKKERLAKRAATLKGGNLIK